MSKKIIPHKLIIDLDKDGTFKSGVLQYRIMNSGAMTNKFYTMGISNGISLPANKHLTWQGEGPCRKR